MSQSELETPNILTYAENLIKQLYGGSASPDHVVIVQQELQELQRRDDVGWVLADTLLASSDANVRFFAALTFAVKINQRALDEEQAATVLAKLLRWLINLVQQGERQLVVRKLCSALVALFVQTSSHWHLPTRHVVCCLALTEAVSSSSLPHLAKTSDLLTTLDTPRLRALLAFTTILAEDATNVSHNTQYAACHERLSENMPDTVAVFAGLFKVSSILEDDFQRDMLDGYQGWIGYARESLSRSSDQCYELKSLLGDAMDMLQVDSSFELVADFFIDLFTNNDDGFVGQAHLLRFGVLLQSEWGQSHVAAVASDPSEDDLQFARLVLSFGQAMAEKIVKGKEQTTWLLDLIHLITGAQSHTTIDQSMGGAICDFWDNYTVSVPIDDSNDLGTQAVLAIARRHWKQAIGELCHAAAIPLNAAGEFVDLKSDNPLSEFRGRVRSAVQASYDDFGIYVLEGLVSTVLGAQGLGGTGLGVLEVAMFCLADLSTSMDYQTQHKLEEQILLEQLFASSVFEDAANVGSTMPIRLRKRVIAIIGDQEGYFKNHPQQLIGAAEVLLNTLQSPPLAGTSAAALRSLADSGRIHLVQLVPQLIEMMHSLLSSSAFADRTKESMVSAVAYVLQVMPQHSTDQQQSLQTFLDLILRQSSNLPPAEDPQKHQRRSLVVLEQLKAMGKALQSPRHGAIYVLDDEEEEEATSDSSPSGVANLNEQILAAIDHLFNPREDGSLLEAACAVISVGYKEQVPGYFQFPPSVTADLITSTPFTNPRLDEAVRTAAAFLSSRTAQADMEDQAKLRLVSFVGDITRAMGAPNTDPELAHYCIDFIGRLIPLHSGCLAKIPAEYITLLFRFALQSLQGHDAMPKRTATNLWIALVGMASGRSDGIVDQILRQFGPDLTRALVFSFGGDAARSELDALSRTFRKLLVKLPSTKQWVNAYRKSTADA